MTLPALPPLGSTDWYTWASGVHNKAAAALTSADIDPTPITAADFGLVAPKGARAYANAAGQTVGNGAYPVYLDLNATDYNEDSTLFTIDLTNNKITVAAAGLYLVSWGVRYAAPGNATDIRDTYLTKNGGNAISTVSAGIGGQVSGFFPLRLAATDYVQIICYVEGASVAVSSANSSQSWLALHRVGL